MAVYALTVGKNEEHRYLAKMLENVHGVFDGHFFYDDQSTDATAFIAQSYGCRVVIRPAEAPSFADDEGLFRGNAWRLFEIAMQPKEGDWVFVIDCDEFLAFAHKPDLTTARETIRFYPRERLAFAFDIAISEVFGFDDVGNPLQRIDGLWNTIHAPRFFEYRPNGRFAPGQVGVPAVPSYVMGSQWLNTELFALAHFGYAHAEDVQSKYVRYHGLPGHLNDHVESILTTPTLQYLANWHALIDWKDLRD